MSISFRSVPSRAPVVLLAILLLCLGFAAGNVFGRQEAARAMVPSGEGHVVHREADSSAKDIDFKGFWDVWDLVKDRYYQQPVSDQALYYGALHGMVEAAGDPYTVYFDPEEAKAFNADLNRSFEGIGANIGVKEEQLQIISALPGTPAEAVGLKTGDAILAIDGVDTTGMPVEEAVSKIRGKAGTSVDLLIFTEGDAAPRTLSIKRETIARDSVEWKIENGIATISIYTFNGDTDRLFSEAVNATLTEGAEGVILDLRGNPGGLLSSAVNVASAWAGYQTIVTEKGRNGITPSHGIAAPRLEGIPTVVLVDGGSASASEIVAGALQDYGLATIVGTQTYGKGSVQDYRDLPDGAAVKITFAEWFTPNDRTIHEVGITPDTVVEYTADDAHADSDPQKAKALEILAAQK